MKQLLAVLAPLKNYKGSVFFNVLFNLLSVLFSLFSFASIAPFLTILFKTSDRVEALTEPTFGWGSDQLLGYLNYHLYEYVQREGEVNALMIFCGIIIAMFFFRNITRYLALYHLATIRNGIVRDFRQMIYRKILRLPMSYYNDERKGNIMSRTTNDVSEIEWSIIGSIEVMFKEPLNIIIFLGSLFFISWEITLVVLVLLPISGFLIARVAKSLKNAAKRGQKQLGDVISTLEETLGGMRIVKAFQAEKRFQTNFEKQNDNFFSLMVTLFRRQYLASPISEFSGAIVMVIVLWIGGRIVLAGDNALTGELFITYIVIFSQLIPPVKSFSDAFFKIQKGIAAKERIDEILDADEVVTDAPGAVPIAAMQEAVVFKDVSFGYSDELVLKDINLSVKKGETIALVGPSGGGKSTLVDLLPRYHDVTSGTITIDEKDIRQATVNSLRGLFGIVSQDSILFNDTVANNIRLGNEHATEAQIIEAAKIANAWEFIENLDGQLNFVVGDGGNKLSGGQKQRLSIARAVLKNPPILILDEATSALDTASEKLVQDALETLMKNRTSFIIAHRLSTITHADRIAVIEQGALKELGTHEELLAKGGLYATLLQMQNTMNE